MWLGGTWLVPASLGMAWQASLMGPTDPTPATDAAWMDGFHRGREAERARRPAPDERFALVDRAKPHIEVEGGQEFHVHKVVAIADAQTCRWCDPIDERFVEVLSRMVNRLPFDFTDDVSVHKDEPE